MKTGKKIYDKLRKEYSDEEIVESFVFNETLPPYEQKQVNDEFRKIRLALLHNMTPKQILVSQLMQMKLLLQEYFKKENFESTFSFSNQLKIYIKITTRSNKEIAGNLNIHPTKLSRILNQKEFPNVDLMYRLEEHSDGELPAYYWWRLHSRELENNIKTDLQKKITEAGKVNGNLQIRA